MSRIIRPVITKATKEIEIKNLLIQDFFTERPAEEQQVVKQEEQLIQRERQIAAAEKALEQKRQLFQQEMELARMQWADDKNRYQQEAYEEGFQQGYEEGHRKGYEETTKTIQEANHVMELADKQANQYLLEQEQLILELAMMSASKILTESLEEQQDRYVQIVKHAVKEAREAEKVRVYVSPADYPLIAGNREELASLLPEQIPFMIFAEESLAPAQGYLDANYGRIIFSIDEQLNELRNRLHMLLAENKS